MDVQEKHASKEGHTSFGPLFFFRGCGAAPLSPQACLREVDILGNFRYCNTWPIAIDMVAAKKVRFFADPLIHWNLKKNLKIYEIFKTSKI